MKDKFKVGATVWVVGRNFDVSKPDRNVIETTITKVGRKLVHVKHRSESFDMVTLKDIYGFSRLVLDMNQFIQDRKIATSLQYGNKSLSLETLQQIADLLEPGSVERVK
jgi:hypothetical protein